MENKIPTAEEFLEKHNLPDSLSGGTLEFAMIEFAKLHCEAQSKAILEKAKTMIKDYCTTDEVERLNSSEIWDDNGSFEPSFIAIVDKDSIKNAYPLENIE